MFWTVARWSLAIAAIALALLSANQAFYSAWQTAAPPGNEFPEAWAYEARKWLGYTIAWLVTAVLAVINLRRGWPYLRSKWNIVLLIVGILAVGYPRAWHFLQVDACLDRGGRWDYEQQSCESDQQ